jgi:hypothetical protein
LAEIHFQHRGGFHAFLSAAVNEDIEDIDLGELDRDINGRPDVITPTREDGTEIQAMRTKKHIQVLNDDIYDRRLYRIAALPGTTFILVPWNNMTDLDWSIAARHAGDATEQAQVTAERAITSLSTQAVKFVYKDKQLTNVVYVNCDRMLNAQKRLLQDIYIEVNDPDIVLADELPAFQDAKPITTNDPANNPEDLAPPKKKAPAPTSKFKFGCVKFDSPFKSGKKDDIARQAALADSDDDEE